jgi:hypothetical protein
MIAVVENIMKMRTTSAPAMTASDNVSHQEIATVLYIKTHNKMKGTSVFTICQVARQVEGVWN